MKRIRVLASVVVTAVLCLLLCACGDSSQGEVLVGQTAGDYRYSENTANNTATITEYLGAESELTIPAKLNGLRVTGIGECAFRNCISLKSVECPSALKEIGWGAFKGCTELAEVTLGNKIERIGHSAFYGTPWMNTQTEEFVIVGQGVLLDYNGEGGVVTLPDEVEYISSAFTGRSTVTEVVFGDKVHTVGGSAFQGCLALQKVQFSDGVTAIESGAFAQCQSLQSVVLPDGLTTLGEQAFVRCTAMTEADLGETLTVIEAQTFMDCGMLKTVTLPETVTEVKNGAFLGANKLNTLYFAGKEKAFEAINLGEENLPFKNAKVEFQK